MRDTCYIKVKRSGIPADKIYKSKPSLKAGEIDIKLTIELPDIIFGSMLEATIKTDKEIVKNKLISELEFELKSIKERE